MLLCHNGMLPTYHGESLLTRKAFPPLVYYKRLLNVCQSGEAISQECSPQKPKQTNNRRIQKLHTTLSVQLRSGSYHGGVEGFCMDVHLQHIIFTSQRSPDVTGLVMSGLCWESPTQNWMNAGSAWTFNSIFTVGRKLGST